MWPCHRMTHCTISFCQVTLGPNSDSFMNSGKDDSPDLYGNIPPARKTAFMASQLKVWALILNKGFIPSTLQTLQQTSWCWRSFLFSSSWTGRQWLKNGTPWCWLCCRWTHCSLHFRMNALLTNNPTTLPAFTCISSCFKSYHHCLSSGSKTLLRSLVSRPNTFFPQ